MNFGQLMIRALAGRDPSTTDSSAFCGRIFAQDDTRLVRLAYEGRSDGGREIPPPVACAPGLEYKHGGNRFNGLNRWCG